MENSINVSSWVCCSWWKWLSELKRRLQLTGEIRINMMVRFGSNIKRTDNPDVKLLTNGTSLNSTISTHHHDYKIKMAKKLPQTLLLQQLKPLLIACNLNFDARPMAEEAIHWITQDGSWRRQVTAKWSKYWFSRRHLLSATMASRFSAICCQWANQW